MEDFAIKPDLAMAINRLAPGAVYWVGETADELEWKCDLPQPTTEEIEAKHAEMIAQFEASEYRRLRASEYPAIGDQLDALYHAGVFPEEMAAEIAAVKDKYPKPNQA